MSTSYYRLAKPITHLKVETNGTRVKLGIWVNDLYTGELSINEHELSELILKFREDEGDDVCPARTHWGGTDVGTVVTIRGPDEMQVISEYGDLLTIEDIRARAGYAKGAPDKYGELFGYKQG